MSNKKFFGILPALITPIDGNSRLLRDAAVAVMRKELEAPISGFYINGATGEGPILPERTRMEMAEVVVDTMKGRGSVINHIGAPDTQSAFALAKHAAQIRCDAISSVLPNFFFKYPETRILDYYRRISDISGLPIIVYAQGLMNQDPVTFMSHVMEVPGVIGVKYTNFDYYGMHRICELNGGDINVINGPDQMLICGLIMGADGGIGTTYNVMPEWFCELYDAFRNGDYETARQIQYRINHVITVLQRHNTIPAVKAYFRLLGIEAGNAAYPDTVLEKDEAETMRKELRVLGIQEV